MTEKPAGKPQAELDHPCRDTCSGWKQGYERGFEAACLREDDRVRIDRLESAIAAESAKAERYRRALEWYAGKGFGHDHDGAFCHDFDCGERNGAHAREALEQME